MHLVSAERSTFAFRADAEPALRVAPGETVRFETSTAPVERLFAAGERWLDILDVRALNAVTGPVYVEGVAPGDAVSVEILEIETADWGWNASLPRFGLADHLLPAPALRRLPIRDSRVVVSDRISLPLRPMVGCLGLAPAAGESSTLSPPYPWGGNFDLVQAAPGNTLLFPAQVPGGIFSLGDLHAAMGANEATSVAIECAGAATVRLGVRTGLRLATPRIETPDRVYVVGLQPKGQIDAARAQAVRLMGRYLIDEGGLSPEEAYALLSGSVDLELGGPAGAVVLASVPRRLLGE